MTDAMNAGIFDRTWIVRFAVSILVSVFIVWFSIYLIEPNQFQEVEALNFLMMAVYSFTAATLLFVAFGSWKLEGYISVATLLLIVIAWNDIAHAMQVQVFWVIRMAEDAHNIENYNSSVVNISNFVYRGFVIFGHLMLFAFIGIASRRVWLPIITLTYAGFWVIGLLISEYI